MKFGRLRGVVEAARTGQLKESSIEKHLCGSLLGTLTVVPKVISICVEELRVEEVLRMASQKYLHS